MTGNDQASFELGVAEVGISWMDIAGIGLVHQDKTRRQSLGSLHHFVWRHWLKSIMMKIDAKRLQNRSFKGLLPFVRKVLPNWSLTFSVSGLETISSGKWVNSVMPRRKGWTIGDAISVTFTKVPKTSWSFCCVFINASRASPTSRKAHVELLPFRVDPSIESPQCHSASQRHLEAPKRTEPTTGLNAMHLPQSVELPTA